MEKLATWKIQGVEPASSAISLALCFWECLDCDRKLLLELTELHGGRHLFLIDLLDQHASLHVLQFWIGHLRDNEFPGWSCSATTTSLLSSILEAEGALRELHLSGLASLLEHQGHGWAHRCCSCCRDVSQCCSGICSCFRQVLLELARLGILDDGGHSLLCCLSSRSCSLLDVLRELSRLSISGELLGLLFDGFTSFRSRLLASLDQTLLLSFVHEFRGLGLALCAAADASSHV
mmetsp:Transcript_44021/g.79155  ORF Transcript_44021/g.79155 Transcript_44021/m.79155 type:complete len:235 (+) Transcript_44021:156-860(+)